MSLPYLHDEFLNGDWAGAPAVVIGGGPSCIGFPWDCLHGQLTVGTNMAFRVDPAVTFLQDWRLIRRLEQDLASGWDRYQGTKVISAGVLAKWREGQITLDGCRISLISKRGTWPRKLSDGLAGGNSGLAALSLAVLLGADPIYLLGFDMSMPKDDGAKRKAFSHWHRYYYGTRWDRTTEAGYSQFIRQFDIVPASVRHRVINVGFQSRLDRFRKISHEDFLNRISAPACARSKGVHAWHDTQSARPA